MNAGPGHSSAGGGRHKRRRGRRPPKRGANGPMGRERQEHQGIFTAPMDHSYRANLGMDNGNGNQGRGPRRPGFSAAFPVVDPEPLPAPHENAASRVFASTAADRAPRGRGRAQIRIGWKWFHREGLVRPLSAQFGGAVTADHKRRQSRPHPHRLPRRRYWRRKPHPRHLLLRAPASPQHSGVQVGRRAGHAAYPERPPRSAPAEL